MGMNVTKLFRKYNKHLIAIFGVALMIVFLLPSTISQMGRRDYTKRVLGEAYGEDIHAYNLIKTQNETELLDDLSRIYLADKPKERSPFEWRMFVGYSDNPSLDYYLLTLEAHKTGISISADQADDFLHKNKIPGKLVNDLLAKRSIPLKTLRLAVANYMSVANSIEAAASGIKVTEPEAEYMFKLMNDKLSINLVTVNANSFVSEVAEPNETELASYFIENQAKFEYPNRIEVEYLAADINEIKPEMTVSEDLAEQYVKENPTEFMKSVMPTTQPGEAPATQPVQVPMTREESIAKAMDILKTNKARTVASRAMSDMYTQTRRFWSQATADENGVLQKPANIADYKTLADELSKKHHIKVTYNRSPLISYLDARKMMGIGRSFTLENGQPLYFSDYAFRIVPIVTPPTGRQASQMRYLVDSQDSSLMRQMDRQGGIQALYMFRVINVDQAHLPKSLDEVKADVVKDYKLKEAYAVAKTSVDELAKIADTAKLDTLLESKNEAAKTLLKKLNVTAIKPQTFSRRNFGYGGRMSPPRIMGVKQDTGEFADTVFEKLWDQPTTMPSGEFTTITLPDEANSCYYVVQMTEKKPGTVDEFDKIKSPLLGFMKMTKQREFIQNWLLPTNIRERTSYSAALPDDES